ncbi:uncharacterized protein FOBCDRAFT_268049 [Fusarium oxysporum Fo47]|uniref:uncharacterized protein n=1 Tax=Fusarium oxysporum Fo47 TaxID=660027 RepID=UPI000FF71D38|nr:uncharacterized protein FOBCDRAFT_268049 [Fusarium oxysporum Fo47]QKD48239.2 hypothetical protein FOBCDRAFT_268049 [Fusarium oxysporum Fo47]RKK34233.1 hypothetical protein BFJ67_g13882 [Fusarium oxysporum f. sp. cepae]
MPAIHSAVVIAIFLTVESGDEVVGVHLFVSAFATGLRFNLFIGIWDANGTIRDSASADIDVEIEDISAPTSLFPGDVSCASFHFLALGRGRLQPWNSSQDDPIHPRPKVPEQYGLPVRQALLSLYGPLGEQLQSQGFEVFVVAWAVEMPETPACFRAASVVLGMGVSPG